MLAAGNTVVVNAHPSGAKVAAEGVRRFNRAIRQAIGLDDLITIIETPTLESAAALFDHRGVKLLVVTGGPAVARAALASKRRAVVAGPGNPPVVVDATADIENAAKSIVAGAAFDNNLLCIGEKQVFAVSDVFDKLMEAVGRHGGFRLNASQIEALTKKAFSLGDDKHYHVNKDLVGNDAAVLARHAGVEAPKGTEIVYGETGADHLFVEHEQMMPFIPFVRVPDVDRAIELARSSEHGYGHTAILHSRDTSVMSRMGKLMDCTVFVINGPSTAGLGLGGEGVLSFSIAGPDRRGRDHPADLHAASGGRRSSGRCGSSEILAHREDSPTGSVPSSDATRPGARHGDVDGQASLVPGGAAARRPARRGRRPGGWRAGPGLRPAGGGSGGCGPGDQRRPDPPGADRPEHSRADGA